jgi:xylose isomerase
VGRRAHGARPPFAGIDALTAYATDLGYGIRLVLEPKPNDPRGDTLLPRAGHVLAFIGSLEHVDMVGPNTEVGTSRWPG